nr:LysR family transcriptional regulator [Sinorhizobium meliloti]
MDTSLLRCFLTVSDTHSFSGAAARLNVTQSTVSHQIARLEEHLGKQLFERTTRNCRITADGRDLIPYAARVLQSVDEMEQNFKPQLISGTVVIGVPDDYYLFDPITEALRGFMTDKPRVDFSNNDIGPGPTENNPEVIEDCRLRRRQNDFEDELPRLCAVSANFPAPFVIE